MAVDKNKLIAEATRLVLKGQYDKAIKAYEKVYAEDRKDIRVLLKIGELQQKKGDSVAAGSTLNLVAEAYRDQGFFLKAVSVYKQVAKLAPEDTRVNERLAELYQQLGLMSEATGQLQALAVALERTGEQGRLLETLRRMVDLDPENVASCVKLGDLYTKANKNQEALELFRRAAGHLRENKRVEEYLKVAERIALLAPDDLKLTRELAHAYLSRGDTKRALAKLQLCFKAEPKEVETLRLLAQAFRDLGQSSKTTSVYKELARVYEEKGRKDEARLTWKQVLELSPDDGEAQVALGNAPAAAPAAPPTAPAPPAARAPSSGPPPGAAARPAPPPPPIPGAGRPAPPPGAGLPAAGAPPAGADGIGRLLTEADVYRKYGLHQKALDHLQKVLALDPEHPDALQRARDQYETLGDRAAAADHAERAVRALLERGPEDRVRDAVERLRALDPARSALPELAAAAGLDLEPAAGPVRAGLGEDDLALAHAAAGDEELVADDAAPSADDGDEPVAVEVEPGEPVDDEEVAPLVVPVEDLVVARADEVELLAGTEDLGDEPVAEVEPDGLEDLVLDTGPAPAVEALGDAVPETQAGEPPVEPGEGAPSAPGREEPLGLGGGAEDEVGVVVGAEGPEPVLDEPAPLHSGAAETALEAREPEGALAVPPLEFTPEEEVEAAPLAPVAPPIELEFVPDEEPPPLEGGVVDAVSRPAAAEQPPLVLPEAFAEPPPAAEPTPPAPVLLPDLATELEEIAFYEGQGLLDEALESVRDLLGSHPDHPFLVERSADLEAQVAAREAAASREAAAARDAAEAHRALPPAPEAPASAAPAAAPGAAAPAGDFDIGRELAAELGGEPPPAPSFGDFQYSVEDVFDQFKRGVDRVVRPEDSDTHYDLGIAYKEMGLVDDALGEFRTALAGNHRKREVDLLTMIGICLGMKGEHREAIQAFRHALHSEYLTGEAAKALHYELGAAHEAVGEAAVGLWYFQKIVKVDPRYRDVRVHVERLGGGPGQAPASTAPPARVAPPPATPVPGPTAPPAAGPSGTPDGAPPEGSRPGPKKNIGYV